MILTKRISDIKPQDRLLVGGKAWRLAVLMQNGLTVPQAVVINTDHFNFWKKNRMLSAALKLELAKLPAVFTCDKYAVRSSANAEDGKRSSFAGQFSSILAIPSTEIPTAVIKVYRSVNQPAVQMYCRYHQIDFHTIRMAVIVQEMINADKGGVMFTKDITNGQDKVVIEAVNGLGEKVVSGLVKPHKLIFSKRNGRPVEGVVGIEKAVLSLSEAKNLFKQAIIIESLFKKPQDIEWAIKGGQVYILQSRPITKIDE